MNWKTQEKWNQAYIHSGMLFHNSDFKNVCKQENHIFKCREQMLWKTFSCVNYRLIDVGLTPSAKYYRAYSGQLSEGQFFF